jgi:hypothetical protein
MRSNIITETSRCAKNIYENLVKFETNIYLNIYYRTNN